MQVNETTTGNQGSPDVATLPGGGFVVVWRSDSSPGTDDSGQCILARRFDPEGLPIEPDWQVNSYTTGNQFGPKVAAAVDGGFLVVWSGAGSFGTDNGSASIHAQRFDANADPVGDEVQVNVYTTASQSRTHAAELSTGDFVVVWESDGSPGSDTSGESVQARLLDAEGSPLGADFQVNTYTTSSQRAPAVAARPDGGFEVVWDSYGSPGTDSDTFSVQRRRFNFLGFPLGSEFQVNSHTTLLQEFPAIALNGGGEAMVVWENYSSSPGPDDEWFSVVGRTFDAVGDPLVEDFQVNTRSAEYQWRPHLATEDGGEFLVVWMDNGDDVAFEDLYARRVDVDGGFHAAETRINDQRDARRWYPRVAFLGRNTAVVVWWSSVSSGTDQDGWSIQARLVRLFLFLDGFETGDTSRWSSQVP